MSELTILLSQLTRDTQSRSATFSSKITRHLTSQWSIINLNYKVEKSIFEEEFQGLVEAFFGFKACQSSQSEQVICVTDKWNFEGIKSGESIRVLQDIKNSQPLVKEAVVISRGPSQKLFIDVLFFKNGLVQSALHTSKVDSEYMMSIKKILISGCGKGNVKWRFPDFTREGKEDLLIKFIEKNRNQIYRNTSDRDGLSTQYCDIFYNRTRRGYRPNIDSSQEVILQGGSTVFCRELPFAWNLESNISEQTNWNVSNLSNCGDRLFEAYYKLAHYCLHRGSHLKLYH